MSHTALNPSPDVPVNAIWLLRLDQSGRVADTGKGTFVSGRAAPPAVGTTNNSQCFPPSVVRLNSTVWPSGEKQGHSSVALRSDVMKREYRAILIDEFQDTDPVQAIEDALRTFPADEVLVVTRPDDDASWLEEDSAQEARERFGVPVTRLTV